MKSFYLLVIAAFLIAGCATQTVVEQTSSAQASDQAGVDASTTSLTETTTSTESSTEAPAETVLEETTPEETTPANPIITAEELAQHDARDDCWIAYQGDVYDITAYVPKHPGGAGEIVPYCGTSEEFEQAFTGQHGTSKVGTLTRQGLYMGKLA